MMQATKAHVAPRRAWMAIACALAAALAAVPRAAGPVDAATAARADVAVAAAPTQRGLLPPQRVQLYAAALDAGADARTRDTAAARHDVNMPGAHWLRLHFDAFELGPDDYVLITAARDGAVQKLDAVSITYWQGKSAYFNGDSVRVELFAAGPARASIAEVVVGEEDTRRLPAATDAPSTICDVTDDRVASSESRVGRLYRGGCTAWLISNGLALSAGHCVDFDPDDEGPMLPDGIVDLNGVMEFDVPTSNANGSTNWAAPEDQYPVNTAGIRFRFDGEGQGLGKDWAVFRVDPNATNGDRPHVTRGFYRMTNGGPAADATIRITGFGSDSGTANFTNQTETGPYVGESSSGSNIWHRYRTDTTGGNSGSPVIWNANGFTIGIHTNGGCGDDGAGANSGTSFEVDALETAIDDFWSANMRYADASAASYPSYSGGGNGTIFNPRPTVSGGVGSTPGGGRLSIVEGTYTEGAQTINKAVTLEAPVGTVVIR